MTVSVLFLGRSLLVAAATTCIICGGVLAQGLRFGSEPPGVEVGAYYTWFQRDISANDVTVSGANWRRGTAFVRLPVLKRVDILLAGMIRGPSTLDEHPGRKYRSSTVGAGVGVWPVLRRAFSLGTTVRFHQTVWIDESPQNYHQRYSGFEIGIHIQRLIRLGRSDYTAWLGPVYVNESIRQYPRHQPYLDVDVAGHLGFRFGVSTLLFNHISPYGQISAIDHWQQEVGITYRL